MQAERRTIGLEKLKGLKMENDEEVKTAEMTKTWTFNRLRQKIQEEEIIILGKDSIGAW